MDREIEALSHKAAAADTAQIRVKDLESAVAALRSDLAAARGEAATLARQQAAAAAEAAEARREADRAARELGSTSDYLEGVMAELAVSLMRHPWVQQAWRWRSCRGSCTGLLGCVPWSAGYAAGALLRWLPTSRVSPLLSCPATEGAGNSAKHPAGEQAA